MLMQMLIVWQLFNSVDIFRGKLYKEHSTYIYIFLSASWNALRPCMLVNRFCGNCQNQKPLHFVPK